MGVYILRNIKNRWERIEVTNDEVAEITKNNFLSNMAIVIRCIKNVPKILASSKELEGTEITKPMIENAINVLSEKMTKPLHYDIENYVDDQLAKKAADL